MDDVREWQRRPLDDVYPVLANTAANAPAAASVSSRYHQRRIRRCRN
jgi:hypothetical protein